MTRLCCTLLLAGAALSLCAADKPSPLAVKIEALIDGPDYAQSSWGLLVVDGESGQTVYERNARKLFIPASTTKLYSCAAALAAFGPNHRFVTPVHLKGEITEKGVAKGDLMLVASGDLTFGGRRTAPDKAAFADHDHTYANSGLADCDALDADPLFALKELAKGVRASGIKELSGDVFIDDRLFEKGRGSGSGPDLITPMLVNDNVVDLVVTPGAKEGEPAKVRVRPETEFIQMESVVVTGKADAEASVAIEATGPTQFVLRGTVPAGGKPVLRIYPVTEPALFARALFVECLRREGVRVSASLRRPEGEVPNFKYTELNRVASYTSEPFAEQIKVTLKVSHNLYASALPALAATKSGGRTVEQGLVKQGEFLKGLGVPVETISFGGGAGGSSADLTTPEATVALLRAMAKRPEADAYFDALPVLGVDGTLCDVLPADSPAKGKARAKTGTLVWYDAMNGRMILRSKALAGRLTAESGKTYYFAMFVNNVPLPKGAAASREGKALAKLCEVIYQGAK